jgi:predicted metal-dependent hydrolase
MKESPEFSFASATTLPFLGRHLPLTVIPPEPGTPLFRLSDERFELRRDGRDRGASLFADWCAAWLRPHIASRLPGLAEKAGVTYSGFSVRTCRSRWGSCSASGRLSFTSGLTMAEADLIEYVLVHELCHRREMNHSSRFWSHVERILPDWRSRRSRLRELSPLLRFFR